MTDPSTKERVRTLHDMISNDDHSASGVIGALNAIDLPLPELMSKYVHEILDYAFQRAQSTEQLAYERLRSILELQAERSVDNQLISNLRQEAAQANRALGRCSDELHQEKRMLKQEVERNKVTDKVLLELVAKVEKLKEELSREKDRASHLQESVESYAIEFDELEAENARLDEELRDSLANVDWYCDEIEDYLARIHGLEFAIEKIISLFYRSVK